MISETEVERIAREDEEMARTGRIVSERQVLEIARQVLGNYSKRLETHQPPGGLSICPKPHYPK